ncbi:hypothetical protein [Actinoplanes sp. NPDC026623]|uniref:hypothetical protein n=1 Tax=Actinoplanes sp. NPDC026623 TaxID=3155610 RepID=UPI0033D23F2A
MALPVVLVREGRSSGARAGAQLPQPLFVAPDQAPNTPRFMVATKSFTLGRISTRGGAITHSGEFRRGKQLKLPHSEILPRSSGLRSPQPVVDHAKILWH